MQELTVASVEKKMPKKEGGTPFYVVKGMDGEEMTTFDAAILDCGSGTKLNVAVIVKGKYTNIDSWVVLEKATPQTAAAAQATNGAAEREKTQSIERQSFAGHMLKFSATMKANGADLSPTEQAVHDQVVAWGGSLYGIPTVIAMGDFHPGQTDHRPVPPTPEDLQRALTQTDKDWKDLESAGSGLDVAWAVNAATRLGWKTTTTLHSWLHSQGIPPVEGETMEEIFANIPGNKVAIIRAAMERMLTEKGA